VPGKLRFCRCGPGPATGGEFGGNEEKKKKKSKRSESKTYNLVVLKQGGVNQKKQRAKGPVGRHV